MRSEIGRLVLDRTFEERDSLNANIKESLNQASEKWGIDCMRYEIKDIKPPEQIKRSMELQAESERIKRSKILNSEGEMNSKINIAEGVKREAILNGEGKARKVLLEADSLCESLNSISMAIAKNSSNEALKLRLIEQYLEALNSIFRKSSVLMVPNSGQTQGVAEILTTYKHIMGSNKSQKMQKTMDAGKSDQVLQQIIHDLNEIKMSQAGGLNAGQQKND